MGNEGRKYGVPPFSCRSPFRRFRTTEPPAPSRPQMHSVSHDRSAPGSGTRKAPPPRYSIPAKRVVVVATCVSEVLPRSLRPPHWTMLRRCKGHPDAPLMRSTCSHLFPADVSRGGVASFVLYVSPTADFRNSIAVHEKQRWGRVSPPRSDQRRTTRETCCRRSMPRPTQANRHGARSGLGPS